MQSQLIYTNKTELYKELEDLSEGEFFAVADVKIKNHLPKWIQFSPQVFWINLPEEEKTLETYGLASDFFLRAGIHRSSTMYAFGGGATTDLAGFVAATILRGISWVAVPTTLLAMIDGSLGGKVAVNTPAGKNLLGAFHAPSKIYLCTDFLKTLDEDNWLSGKGEMLKYGFLSSEIHSLIKKKVPIEKIAEACAKYKMDLVERDFRESGERIHLNLGHTLGHAFEFALKIPHGLAVVMGMKYLFEALNKEEALKSLNEMAALLSIPVSELSLSHYPGFEKNKIFDYIQLDKKKSRDKIKLVLTEGPGKVSVNEMPLGEFKSKINAHVDFADK